MRLSHSTVALSEASERLLGAEHPNTLVSLNNLAGLYESQGRYDEAEPLYQRALEAQRTHAWPRASRHT